LDFRRPLHGDKDKEGMRGERKKRRRRAGHIGIRIGQ